MKKLIVTKKYNNKKLNKFLKDQLPSLSDGLFYKTLIYPQEGFDYEYSTA